MKKIRNVLFMLIAFLGLFMFVSCGDKKANINVTNISAMRTRIGVSVVIEDKNDVITESSVLGRIFDTL